MNHGVSTRPWNWVDPVSRKAYTGTRTSPANHSAILEHRKKLPIYEFRRQFLHAVESNQGGREPFLTGFHGFEAPSLFGRWEL